MLKKRRLKRTCPRCRQRTLTRIGKREGIGALVTLTRFCVNCEYSDGFVREFTENNPERFLLDLALQTDADAYTL